MCQNCAWTLGICTLPGAMLFFSRSYTKDEMPSRATLINIGDLAAQGVVGLIVAEILADMDGVRGIPSVAMAVYCKRYCCQELYLMLTGLRAKVR